jgi:hypothetical protein
LVGTREAIHVIKPTSRKWVGQNLTSVGSVHTVFLARKSPYTQSYKVQIYG